MPSQPRMCQGLSGAGYSSTTRQYQLSVYQHSCPPIAQLNYSTHYVSKLQIRASASMIQIATEKRTVQQRTAEENWTTAIPHRSSNPKEQNFMILAGTKILYKLEMTLTSPNNLLSICQTSSNFFSSSNVTCLLTISHSLHSVSFFLLLENKQCDGLVVKNKNKGRSENDIFN